MAGHARHAKVGKHDTDFGFFQNFNGSFTRRFTPDLNLSKFFFQVTDDPFEKILVIINNQYGKMLHFNAS